MSTCWKVFCEEKEFPGLWPRWFKYQCVAVGWSEKKGFTLEGKAQDQSWAKARNALKRVKQGDLILAQLKDSRVARIGEVVRAEIRDDQWNPTVPPSKEKPGGGKGRRIAVRWDLTVGPTDADKVVLLPASCRLPVYQVRPAICQLDPKMFDSIVDAMKDENNWVGFQGRFDYERSLSDYIATYPHHLEDNLMPYPDAKVREKVFSDRTRSDVLLIVSTPVENSPLYRSKIPHP